MLEAFSLIGKITIEGVDKVDVALKTIDEKGQQVSNTLANLSKSMEKTGKTLSKYVTLPLSVAGGFITKLGMDFEQAMAEVQAISGATGEELAKLEEKARELGATTKFSAREAASALKYMAMAGWQTEQMLSGIDGVMKLAAASGEDLATVSDIVTDALTAFNLTADQATQFADLLASASANANTNVAMMGESFKYVAPLFGSLGFSAEDAALALGLMANAGIKGSQAGTSLRAAVTRLVNATGEAATIIDELGIRLTDEQGNMLSFQQVIDQLREKFSNLTQEQQAQYASLLFGQEAMSGMLAIINASEEDYRKLTEATRNYTGAADEMAKTMSDTLRGRIDEFRSALEEVALKYFDTVEPFLKSAIELATRAIEVFGKLPAPLRLVVVILSTLAALAGPVLLITSKLINAWTTVAPVVTKLAPALINIGGILSKGAALFAKLITLIKAAGAAIAGVISGPVAVAIAVAAALAAAAYLVIKNWDALKGFFSTLWEGIKEGFAGFANWFVEKWEAIKEFLSQFNLFEIGKNIITSLWEGVKSFFSSIWEGIRSLGQGIINVFKDVFGIASPSRVFQDIGENLSEGLALGLEDGLDKIRNTSVDVAMNAIPPQLEKLSSFRSGTNVQEVRHSGTITICGVSNDGEFERVVELVLDRILSDQRRELRMA